MGAERGRRRRRKARRAARWQTIALALVLGAAAGFFFRQRSLPLPPLRPPRFVARQPRHAPPDAQPETANAPSTEPAPATADTSSTERALTERAPPEPRAPVDERAAVESLDAAPESAPAAVDTRPRVAIVIDDLGDSLEAARAVLDLEPAVTVAVIPFRRHSAHVAAAAVERGREVILHLPLEPERVAEMGAAPGFLRTSMSSDGLERQLDADLAAVPYIVGVNGHMGSRFTQDPVAMERLLGALRARGLFYLDSLTTPASVAPATAARLGVPFAQRALFLDHDPRPEAIARALGELDALARAHHGVIAIGHPHATTIAALGPWLAGAAAAGIHVVPASALVR
jgi:polysaccharide deacetylase 2 family uncharacterized protein YibQ